MSFELLKCSKVSQQLGVVPPDPCSGSLIPFLETPFKKFWLYTPLGVTTVVDTFVTKLINYFNFVPYNNCTTATFNRQILCTTLYDLA